MNRWPCSEKEKKESAAAVVVVCLGSYFIYQKKERHTRRLAPNMSVSCVWVFGSSTIRSFFSLFIYLFGLGNGICSSICIHLYMDETSSVVAEWHALSMTLCLEHSTDVCTLYSSALHFMVAESERHRRHARVAIIDDALNDVRAFATAAGSSQSLNALSKALKQTRVKHLEDTNALLLKKFDSVKLERDHFASLLSTLERRAADGSKTSAEAVRLREENARLRSEVLKLKCASRSFRDQHAQTIYSTESDLLHLRRHSKHIACQNMNLQETCGRLEAEMDHVLQLHSLTDKLVFLVDQDRRARERVSQKKHSATSLENQMLHEELSLCLRRIATLEADHGTASKNGQSSSSPPSVAKASQTDEDKSTDEAYRALGVENAKLKMLLKKFVGLVASEVSR